MFPEEVTPTSTSQQESIRNKWTTYTNVNDWFSANKPTLVHSGLAQDEPMTLPDGEIAELIMGPQEMDWVINFDETDRPFSTQPEKGGSQEI